MVDMSETTVVITGASRGIGAAAARKFAREGAKVALLARSAGEIANLAGEIGEAALAIPCDVARWHEIEAAFVAAEDAFGPVNVLINNAGTLGRPGMMGASDPEIWGQTIDVNLKGVYYGMRAALGRMVPRGGGTIITVSSGAAHRPVEGWSDYCASKAGAAMLTRSLHHEHARDGIRAMGLSPGTVATEMQREIKASGVGPVAKLEWSDHIPADWPAEALFWMATPEADEYLGEEISLREPEIRSHLGLA